MKEDLKKRIKTSILLLIALYSMLLSNFILAYFLIIIGVISLIEFFNMNMVIFKKNKFIQIVTNVIFAAYTFFICTFFLIFSTFGQLKIIAFIIILTCVFSDIGGFIFGRIFKGPRLSKISPKKTISGSIGSILFSSIFFSTSIFYLTKNFDMTILLIGISISIVSQLGDLFFSYIKRKASFKDTGSFLPGHGGVLDRIDGIFLGFPIGFLLLFLIY